VSDAKRTDPSLQIPVAPDRSVHFSIVHRGHRFELAMGTLMIGRGSGCQLVLEDALVSRKHARIEVRPDSATLHDLGSVNGVFVNGDRMGPEHELKDGDRITIGQQEILVFATNRPATIDSTTARLTADTLVGFDVSSMTQPPREEESTHQGDALELLGGVVDKVLALGRGEEAERIIGTYLKNFLGMAQRAVATPGAPGISPDLADRAAAYAVKIAAATKKGEWVNYAFELFTVQSRPLPAAVVDQLYTVLRNVHGVDLKRLRDYITLLRSISPRLGPADRFVAQRIEGLERLASA
jgi:hypothetical protein